jgi:predicted alpha/beta-hydrolase family hydrolase
MNIPELLCVGPQHAIWTLVLGHGASEGMDSPFMAAFAEGLAVRGASIGSLQVVRFEFPYMSASRREGRPKSPDQQPVLLESWRAVIAAFQQQGYARERLVIGGKSLGGRMASLIADEQGVAGLVCLGYPFHPPGKPEQLRTAQLENLTTPTLICQGTRDPFGTAAEVSRYRLAVTIRFHWLEDGDHSFQPRQLSGRTVRQNWEAAMDAIIAFIAGLA